MSCLWKAQEEKINHNMFIHTSLDNKNQDKFRLECSLDLLPTITHYIITFNQFPIKQINKCYICELLLCKELHKWPTPQAYPVNHVLSKMYM